ncbi:MULTISPECIES: hypothetical protein [Dehalococcoides]|jgi:hypothetical protein|uniref:Uncharacterized protein n=1 Tax=Dehalococcoides mccartyi (strain VS) TaxID=311424 RepID=D2BIG4_DEHMV|nr:MULTISPECIES: hypothetical protein [Dehalococcoides]ACZ62114.1 hypothetical protein DhcVS_997 [Dehalococcoides mccartyi VS]AHB13792.1 hypothetical protein GY50_1019 [Dehalococcoides mccartyi GY50]AII58169.1 hypothetical protein X792_05580 [Dehalococcoides mccartyi CG1]APH12756.1 hypothetical protein ASJ33_06115 [Dehalococcoides mccartyi]QYY57830.1 hypothetical protein CWV2_001093 [Dehalococcoides mccartyi]
MSKKRGVGKLAYQDKKNKTTRQQMASETPKAEAAGINKTESAAAAPAAQTAKRNIPVLAPPEIGSELKLMGILAVIIAVALAVLALVI